MRRSHAAIGLVTVLAACQGTDAGPETAGPVDPVPAVRAGAEARDLARISAALADLLGREHVDLSADAFLGSSTLSIERRPLRRLEGRLVGREVAQPAQHVQLRLTPDGCELVGLETGERRPVPDLDCVPAPR